MATHTPSHLRISAPKNNTTPNAIENQTRFVNTVIIGAGQAGLSMSKALNERGIGHVVLEKGEVANSWRTERWDSLRLLTPNWQTRLPGWHYTGDDPDGYMTMPEVANYLDSFADSFDAPVHTGTTVESVKPMGGGYPGYDVKTSTGRWYARSVVIAAGACSTPAVPAIADRLPDTIHQLSPIHYKNPSELPEGGVLIVGASASGVQLADEIARSGRHVTLAVGRHVRLPRTYRGRDTQWWLDKTGALDKFFEDVSDIEAARRAPSLQIVGTPDHRTLDLATLAESGVRLVGRVDEIDGNKVGFAPDLDDVCADADARLNRMLDGFDAWAYETGVAAELSAPERPEPVVAQAHPARIDLESEGIRTIIWATGFKQHYPWLDVRVTEANGGIRHQGGVVTEAPGLYVLGLPFLRRRKSTFIDGAGIDADDLATHLSAHLDRVPLVP